MRKALLAAGIVIVLLLTAVGAAAWYFSSQVIAIEHDKVVTPEVIASDGSTITLKSSIKVASPGTFGIRWAGGSAFTDYIVSSDHKTVRRNLRDVVGQVPTSGTVVWDRHVWNGDPKSTLNIDYENVGIKSDLGDMPAWVIPGDAPTWVIAVHGRGADRDSALRVLPTLRSLHVPVLVASYRNDVNAPRSPDGKDHLGDTEWKDIDAAVTYAHEHGAQHVVLYGWSKGGAIVMTTLNRSPQKSLISGVVLDAPVVNWRKTLDFQGEKRNVPPPIVDAAMVLSEKRAHLELDDFTQKSKASALTVPILLFHGEKDETVPLGPSKEFAEANPSKVQLELFPGATHTAEWNADSERYDRVLTQFLTPLAGQH